MSPQLSSTNCHRCIDRYRALLAASHIAARKRVAKVLEKQRKNQEKRKIRQQNKKKKGKKNTDSKKNISSNLRTDGFENGVGPVPEG